MRIIAIGPFGLACFVLSGAVSFVIGMAVVAYLDTGKPAKEPPRWMQGASERSLMLDMMFMGNPWACPAQQSLRLIGGHGLKWPICEREI